MVNNNTQDITNRVFASDGNEEIVSFGLAS